MEERIISIIADIISADASEIKGSADANGLWDSLKRAEILFALEDEFDIFFEPDEIEYMSTVNRVIETVGKKIG